MRTVTRWGRWEGDTLGALRRGARGNAGGGGQGGTTAREAALAQLRARRAALRQVEDMLIGAGALELSAK